MVDVPRHEHGPKDDQIVPEDRGIAHFPLDLSVSREEFRPGDLDMVSEVIEGFMSNLYGTNRYIHHNDGLLELYKIFFSTPDTAGPGSEEAGVSLTERMTIFLHDFVDHTILKPEKTAERTGLDAQDIKSSALSVLIDLYENVEDADSLEKAYLFGIDKAKWEEAGQVWRAGATERIKQEIAIGAIDPKDSEIILAAIHKGPELEDISSEKLEQVLGKPEHLLKDLPLADINLAVINHNIKGIDTYGLELLENLRNPAPGNPAAAYRDRIEAINFVAPTLQMLGRTRLANEIRGIALEGFYEDPDGHAAEQHRESETYVDAVAELTDDVLKGFDGIVMEAETRVKAEGSIRQKLASDDYTGATRVSDGIGRVFKVPDKMSLEEMEYFAREYRDRLLQNPQVRLGHPLGEEQAFEVKKNPNGYEAVNMTFYYYPDPQSNKGIEFEIQVLTEEQYTKKLYGPWSDLLYKAKKEYKEEYQAYFDHLAKRAAAEDELAPGTTIQSIAEMVAVTPEFPSVFTKLYRAVNAGDACVLVPAKLQELSERVQLESPSEEGYLTVLPPERVTERQFLRAIKMLSGEVVNNKNIYTALQWARESEAGSFRDDGKTPVFEGHILPTALAAVMRAIQSGEIWSEREIGVTEHISNIATVALLHDYVEKQMQRVDDIDVKMAIRGQTLYEIRREFGETVRNSVEALTVPVDIKDHAERHDQYNENIAADEYALLVKPDDRLENHISDIARLAELDAEIKQIEAAMIRNGTEMPLFEIEEKRQEFEAQKQKTFEYLDKTQRHLAEILTSEKLPNAYTRAYNVILQYAQYFGYEPEAVQS